MSQVRRIGPLKEPVDFWTAVEGMLWKFIPAALAFLLLLAVVFTQFDPAPDNVVADIYNGGNLESGLYAFYDQ